ncbi:MAG: HAMP domain-containing histidine kinase [Bryobacteraceae bacterium]|nr:HAMP domain-containing histidine kinase [Bryobacteraceae bacterium]
MSDPGAREGGDLTLQGLVHDLNNVFETISEAAELLAGDDRWREVAEALARSVDCGRRIVGVYADQSRAGTDLGEIVDRAETFLRDFLRHLAGTKIRVHRHIDRDHRLPGNGSDWERVFMNLLLNAAQAMKDRGGGTIEVNSRIEDGSLVVEVADDGPGIDEAILPRIFTARFSTRSRHAGLGLHIVRTLVEGNGATASAANRPAGAGAVFTIRAPLPEE